MAENVVPLTLTSAKALEIIRDAAADSGRVIFTDHAQRRMRKRRITLAQVLTCLRRGVIVEAPYWDSVHGTWPVTMERLTAGERVTVGMAIDLTKRVIIVTAF